MIQTKIQFNLKNAQQYFREHLSAGEYYSENRQVLGEWLGQGAEKLGLKGAVGEKAFIALSEGKNPETGLRLGQRLNSVRQEGDQVKANRRIFFDFTIAPPKSVSVVGLMQDERVVALHDQAVRQAMIELEKRAEARVRRSKQNDQRMTGNIVTACFRHETSRELDPHLHTHCVVMNATFDPVENRWKALHPAGMYRAHRFATALYRHELSKGLRALGYELTHHPRGFEIKSVPPSVIERFSKRHRQIDEETYSRIGRDGFKGNMAALREQVAHDNRRRKQKESTAERLRPSWTTQLRPDEQAALQALAGPALKPKVGEKADVTGLVAWADEHIFARRAVANEHELLAAALEHGQGQDFDLATLRTVMGQRDYLRDLDSERIASREVYACERELVRTAQDGRDACMSLNRHYQPSPALSAEQATAVEKILHSRDRITLLRGGAGTGKSFALKEIERGLTAAGHPVVVLAPQRQQVQDLQADGLKADTLALFLERKTLADGAVVILDEAGQVGARELCALLHIVRPAGGRVILSGDTRQHGAVAASDALCVVERHAKLRPAEIRTIRRQDPKLAESRQQREFIRAYRRAVKAAARGDVGESFDRLDTRGCIREVARENPHDAVAAEYLAARSRQEKVLVVAQTREAVRAVNEVIRDKLREAGQLGADAVLMTHQPVDLDTAQKRDRRFYQPGYCAVFLRSYGRFARGETCAIIGANERGVVLEKQGVQTTVSYRYADRFTVAATQELKIAEGDRLQLKFNGLSAEGKKLNNGELVTVRTLEPDGTIIVEAVDKSRKTLAPSQRLFVRGYAVTSYGSQGKTVDTVIVADDGSKAATNAKQWYVAISRGRKRVVVFTPDKAALREKVQQAGDRELAVDLVVRRNVSMHMRQGISHSRGHAVRL